MRLVVFSVIAPLVLSACVVVPQRTIDAPQTAAEEERVVPEPHEEEDVTSSTPVLVMHTPSESIIESATVVRVIDGDTIAIGVDENGDGILEPDPRSPSGFKEIPVRLIGVDAPEMGDVGEAYAYDKLVRLVEWRIVRLEYQEIRSQSYFRKKRLLCDVYVDDEDTGEWLFVNAVLVAEGFAEASPLKRSKKNRRHAGCLQQLEDAAWRAHKGIWRKEATRKGRKTTLWWPPPERFPFVAKVYFL